MTLYEVRVTSAQCIVALERAPTARIHLRPSRVITMANNFPRADNYTTPSGSQINLYGAQQISPVNSASATPLNVSPTSPRNPSQLPHFPLHTRQLRPPKSPLYVPAVLRPTERPIKQTPLTPPRSVHGSLDSLDGVEAGRMLSRRPTGESMTKAGLSRLVEGERIGESRVGTVTGLPTREHWKVSVHLECLRSSSCGLLLRTLLVDVSLYPSSLTSMPSTFPRVGNFSKPYSIYSPHIYQSSTQKLSCLRIDL